MINARIAPNKLHSKLRGLEKGMAGAARSAINRAATSGQSYAAKVIGSELAVRPANSTPARYIKGQIKVTRAQGERLRASIECQKKQSHLALYKPRQTKTGLSVRIWKKRPLQKIPHGFLSPNRGFPMIRARIGGRFAGRYPVRALYGPGVGVVFEAHLKEVAQQANVRVKAEYQRAVRGLLLRGTVANG